MFASVPGLATPGLAVIGFPYIPAASASESIPVAPAARTMLVMPQGKKVGHIQFKTPEEVKDFTFDWTQVIGTGRRIVTSIWQTTGGVVVAADGIDSTGAYTTIITSGGVLTATSYMKNIITDDKGIVLSESFRLVCQHDNFY